MKIRLDFVTNSSSASFICIFGKPITSKEIIEKYIKENNIPLNQYNGFYTGQYIIDNYKDICKDFANNDWCWADCIPNVNEINPDNIYYVDSDYDDMETDKYGDIPEEDLDRHYDRVYDDVTEKYGALFEFDFDQGSGRDG